jgi:heavy metal sensor kinase
MALDDRGDPESATETTAEDLRDFQEEAGVLLPHAEGAAQVVDDDGAVLMRYGAEADGPLLPVSEVRRVATGGVPRTIQARLNGDQTYLLRADTFHEAGHTRVLVVAESMRRVEVAVERVVILLLVAGPVALAGMVLGGYWIARRVLRPIERMTSDAAEIGIDQLDERVAVPATTDEVSRLAHTLNAMLERIQQGVAEKHRLIADASHGLRTPLAVMRAEIDVSLRSDDLSPAAREVLASAREEVDGMSRTVDNLLTMAEADEGRLELLSVRVGLMDMVEEAVRPLSPLAAAKGVVLRVSGEDAAADADPRRLNIAVTNLVENAIKFTPAGGEVSVRAWTRDGTAGVSVSDQGSGISATDQAHLFERFYRADHQDGIEVVGTGLGLAIVHEIASAHGGWVLVESELGRGSTFSLALPAWRVFETVASGPSSRS